MDLPFWSRMATDRDDARGRATVSDDARQGVQPDRIVWVARCETRSQDRARARPRSCARRSPGYLSTPREPGSLDDIAAAVAFSVFD